MIYVFPEVNSSGDEKYQVDNYQKQTEDEERPELKKHQISLSFGLFPL